MKKRSILKATLLLLFFLCAAYFLYKSIWLFRNQTRMEQAISIYACYPAYGMDIEEYEINFEEQKLYEYHCYIDEYVPRDTTSENRGWQSAEPLSDEQITALRHAGAAILNWKRYYDNSTVMDGVQWRIIITFQDGTIFRTAGSNSWPLNYKTIQEELRSNDADILRYGPINHWD